MVEWADLPVLSAVALFSAFLGSVAGSGGTAVLLPVLVLYYGIHLAVPIITIANLSANISRVAVHFREIRFPVALWFGLGAVPLTMLGTWLFTVTAPEVLTRVLGAFMLGLVVWRRLRPIPPGHRHAAWFLPLGMGFGLLSGFVSGVGPLMGPFFLAFGLFKGAYIGTDALGTVFMQTTKLAVFGGADFLGAGVVGGGLTLVPFMVLGTVLGKRLLDRLPEHWFAVMIEVTLIVAGLNFLVRG